MSEVWLTIGCLALAMVAIKGAGPAIVGGRELPERALGVIALLAPALLAALVVTETLTVGDRELGLDPRAAGAAVAAAALLLRAPMPVAVVLAAAATAGLRALL